MRLRVLFLVNFAGENSIIKHTNVMFPFARKNNNKKHSNKKRCPEEDDFYLFSKLKLKRQKKVHFKW
jgi:hypothetical protein